MFSSVVYLDCVHILPLPDHYQEYLLKDILDSGQAEEEYEHNQDKPQKKTFEGFKF